MAADIKRPKKMIEVALPLDAINVAAAKEKSIRHGHPSTLHLWWARRPLAAARAVIFAQMVNDPGYERELGRGVNKQKAKEERERLFGIIERLVLWENTNNESVLKEARDEIWKSWRETCALNKDHPEASELFNPEKLPAFHDPFAGGGAIPLEAQRLGLEAYASDLNPVAVLINKAMIEIPPKFAGYKPVGPRRQEDRAGKLIEDWSGAKGLAEDIRRYGAWLRGEAFKRIGHLYPSVEITAEMAKGRADLKPVVGEKLTVIAWLWARTVKSPNPAFSTVDVPLASTFILSSKEGKEAYVQPIVQGDQYTFAIRLGLTPTDLESGTKLARGAKFKCLLSETPIEPKYIYAEANAKRMGARLMAIVADGPHGRVYLAPGCQSEIEANSLKPEWSPEVLMPENPRWFSPPLYGLKTYGDLFTPRQLVALNTLSGLVQEAVEKCYADAVEAGVIDDGITLDCGGKGATAYSQAVGLYLSMALSRLTDICNSLCRWENTKTQVRNLFGRHAIPMMWDFAENNVFAGAAGDYQTSLENMVKALLQVPARGFGVTSTADARVQTISAGKVVSTDPPYYDNIGYADLSDFFYVWLKRGLGPVLPALFSLDSVPKNEELVATPYRHGGKENAEAFFLNGMKDALSNLALRAHPAFPVTIYYAFKQSETSEDEGTFSTGWETFLEAVLSAGFCISGTWPMRTELGNRMIGTGTNALASSVVLVCNQRPANSIVTSRREFIRELNSCLPEALEDMTRGAAHSPVAPVDLSQAIIGPGMAIFSKYSAVLEADGKPMSVRTALQLINRFLAQDEFDVDTQFCLSWYEDHGWDKGKFGEADVLVRAKGTSVEGLREAGVIDSVGGSVRLLKTNELPDNWRPETDSRVSVWELLHHMIRRLNRDGEAGAGELLAKTNRYSESVRTLAYRLYTLSERKGWAQEAGQYNTLVLAWEAIEAAAQASGYSGSQMSLIDDEASKDSNGSDKNKSAKTSRKKPK